MTFDDDKLPKVTIRLLRDADTGCPRLLASTYRNRSATRGTSFRGRAEARVRGDARLAHATMRAPSASDFPRAVGLLPEEQALHAATANAYVALFGDAPALALDVAEWETVRADLGFRLVGPVGLVVERPDGAVEVRRLQFGRPDAPDDTELRFLAARLGAAHLRVVTADLVNVSRHETEASIDPFENDEWMRDRVERAAARGDEPLITHQCTFCGYITDCEAHR